VLTRSYDYRLIVLVASDAKRSGDRSTDIYRVGVVGSFSLGSVAFVAKKVGDSACKLQLHGRRCGGAKRAERTNKTKSGRGMRRSSRSRPWKTKQLPNR